MEVTFERSGRSDVLQPFHDGDEQKEFCYRVLTIRIAMIFCYFLQTLRMETLKSILIADPLTGVGNDDAADFITVWILSTLSDVG